MPTKKSFSGKPFDIIAIGDCGMDVFMGLDNVSSRICRKDTKTCFLQMSYADKIESDSQVFATGGNSANLSIGSSRLGLKTAFYTELGKDMIGNQIIDALKKDGVSTRFAKQSKDYVSNFHIVLNHEAERTILIYHNDRKYKLPAFPKSEWIYYSSMGEGFEKIQPALIRHVKKNKIKLGFNPGTLQFKAGFKALEKVLKVTEVLILNTQEGHRLLGHKHNGKTDFKKLLVELTKVGPKKAIVTDGPEGAYGYDGEKFWYMPIYDVPVIERTGAGDSFSTGFIAAMAYGKPIHEAMKWGTFNSAGVIQQIGPQAGLMKKSKMQKMLRENKDFLAREM